MTSKYATRTYRMNDGVVIIKQTQLRNGRYVVCSDNDNQHIERHIDAGPNQEAEIGRAVIAGHNGQL
ncbi:hypothetical protein [Gimesia algae]|uniref:Uncharacterized protein n=1 Tax=Gimesia algae TaxID=2527971 RepID=A0A517V7J3_9PLAN|nr:hypothetical protein [Gimesia algae]QDT88977.1 hypothetical protein Pan161_05960 [Gimesia algae]